MNKCRSCNSKPCESGICDICYKYQYNLYNINQLKMCDLCQHAVKYDLLDYCDVCHHITYCTQNPVDLIVKQKIAMLELELDRLRNLIIN